MPRTTSSRRCMSSKLVNNTTFSLLSNSTHDKSPPVGPPTDCRPSDIPSLAPRYSLAVSRSRANPNETVTYDYKRRTINSKIILRAKTISKSVERKSTNGTEMPNNAGSTATPPTKIGDVLPTSFFLKKNNRITSMADYAGNAEFD